jgi:hypothetical protein
MGFAAVHFKCQAEAVNMCRAAVHKHKHKQLSMRFRINTGKIQQTHSLECVNGNRQSGLLFACKVNKIRSREEKPRKNTLIRPSSGMSVNVHTMWCINTSSGIREEVHVSATEGERWLPKGSPAPRRASKACTRLPLERDLGIFQSKSVVNPEDSSSLSLPEPQGLQPRSKSCPAQVGRNFPCFEKNELKFNLQ